VTLTRFGDRMCHLVWTLVHATKDVILYLSLCSRRRGNCMVNGGIVKQYVGRWRHGLRHTILRHFR